MRRTNAAESGSDRVAFAKDAGMGRISLFGVLAGTMVAYGSFVVLLAVAAVIADVVDVGGRIASLSWEELGAAGGLIVAAVLFVSYLFGGYVAGRMARRAGGVNGFLVFVLGVLVVVAVSVLINTATDGDDILNNFRAAGIPTSADEWGNAGTVAGLASLIALVVGPVIGGVLGERWHAKLVHRAMDPTVGVEARQRRQARKMERQAGDRHATAGERAWTPAPPTRPDQYRPVGEEAPGPPVEEHVTVLPPDPAEDADRTDRTERAERATGPVGPVGPATEPVAQPAGGAPPVEDPAPPRTAWGAARPRTTGETEAVTVPPEPAPVAGEAEPAHAEPPRRARIKADRVRR